MQFQINQIKRDEAGFTLVELAIVMIIIGLLIGGVLKGQELIANAQVTAQVAQMKGIDAAVSTFRDTYKAFPGDMGNATDRLPSCEGAACANNGDPDGRLDDIGADPTAPGDNMFFWAHLAAADLFSGVDQSEDTDAWGQAYPAANAGGGYHAGQYAGAGATFPGNPAGVAGRSGTYLAWHNTPNEAPTEDNASLSTASAARIDLKMDDGAPNTGSVIAMGARPGCALGTGPTDIYDEAAGDQMCGLYVRIQQ